MQFLEDFHLIFDANTVGIIQLQCLETSFLMFDFQNEACCSHVQVLQAFAIIISEQLFLHRNVEYPLISHSCFDFQFLFINDSVQLCYFFIMFGILLNPIIKLLYLQFQPGSLPTRSILKFSEALIQLLEFFLKFVSIFEEFILLS